MKYLSTIFLLLSLPIVVGCIDDQEIFFEDLPTDESLETVHIERRDKPYPREENELYINPAPLIVPQAARGTDEFLEFELSQNSEFPEGSTYRSGQLPWNIYNIHEAMAAGQWYWRFRKVDSTGRAAGWSKVYSFTVTGEEPVFVTPDFSVLQQNIPSTYPRMHCYIAEDIEKAKATIQEHREYEAMVGRAESALNESNLTADLFSDTGLLYEYVFDYLNTAYLLTGEKKYYDKILDYGRKMISASISDDVLFASNFQSGHIVSVLSVVYDDCQTDLTEAEKTTIEETILKLITKYYEDYRGLQENWLFDEHTWQQSLRCMTIGAFMICQEYPDAMKALEYFYELWASRAPSTGFNRDGVWFNGQGYLETNQYSLYYMPMLFSHLTGANFLQHPWYQNAGKALVYSWLPESTAASFGDYNRGDWPYRSRVALADFLARELGDASAAWYVQECQRTVPPGKENDYSLYANFDLRLYRMSQGDAPYDILETAQPDLNNYIWYKDSGEGVAHSNMENRNDNLTLAFRSSPFGSGNHTHSDQNSFKVLYRGTKVYMNAGYYQNYADAHALLQYRNTRGHNTVMINGIGQPFSKSAYGNITRGLNGDNLAYFEGDASSAYHGKTDQRYWENAFATLGISETPQYGFGDTPLNCYKRQVFMLRPNKIVVYDELSADEPATWQWLLHSPVEFIVHGNTVTTTYEDKGGFTATAQIFGDQMPSISVTDKWFPGGEPADQDPERYPKQWHLTAELGESAAHRVLTVIQVTDGEEPIRIWKINNQYQLGDWVIEAEMNPSLPAAISIVNEKTGTCFSNGFDTPVIDGVPYQRQEENSSVLYDAVQGRMQVQEIGDKPVQTTRSIVK